MKTIYTLALCTILSLQAFSQKVTLSGYLKDGANGEALIGATVYVPELEIGVVSNAYGFYSLSMPKGFYTVEVSYIGYETSSQKIDVKGSKQLSVKLEEARAMLDEVIVTSEAKNKNVESVSMSVEKLPIKTIKKLPAFMGEVDVIKSIQLLPGIQSGGEGSSGLYVRGGGPDENLLLLDEAPVYNASHLMGFFSVFNSDAIKDIKVYKGGIPAEYGGKASSVIDIRQKDGNSQRWGFSGGIGNISSRFTVEGPIVKDKWSLILSGRRTYGVELAQLAQIEAIEGTKLYFYDLNAKSNLIINDKNRIFISAYNGDDYFSLGESIFMRWGNSTLTTRWNHIFGDKLFLNTSVIYSRYDYEFGVPGSGADNFNWTSMIRDWNTKLDFSYYLNPENQIKFGVNAIYHHFEPGNITATEESYFSDSKLTYYNAAEGAAYISNEQKFGSRLSMKYGIRYAYFQQLGEGNQRVYSDPEKPDGDDVIDTISFSAFEKIGDPNLHFEPRFALKYTLSPTSSFKLSYNRMVQNLHLISNTNSPLPFDIWLPTSTYIKPLIADQVAVGYFRNFMDDAVETSAEIYYKEMQNVLDYKDGAELFFNESIETELLHGSGKSYGLELLVKKQQGDFTGWVGYTLARTTRKVPGINNNKEYPSSYDRTHDLSFVASYQISKYLNLAANFVYATGNPTSYPIAKYTVHDNQMYYYSDRNSYRIPDYHRLDLSMTYDWKKNDRRKYKQSINVSLYNVYNRRNTYSISFRSNEDNPNVTEAVRISIIGSVIPSVTYNFTF